MAHSNINQDKHLVNPEHPSWIPTETIEKDLQEKFPDLLFPYMKQDHIAGVNSNVHAWCERHDTFTRLSVAGARHRGTKWGCSICADEHKGVMPEGVSRRYNFDGYIGRRGVQSGIFKAVKAVFPDAIWEHRMDNRKEIDIYVPSIRAGIEYNGNYYHSDKIQKDNYYHYTKTLLGVEENKAIFHIFTEEAVAPYTNLVNLLKLRTPDAPYLTKEEVVKLKYKQISGLKAEEFHTLWNFRLPDIRRTCDRHIGCYRGSDLIAVMSGRSTGIADWHSYRLHGMPLEPMCLKFLEGVPKGYSLGLSVDLRNPAEQTIIHKKLNLKCSEIERYKPCKIPLNSRFQIDSFLEEGAETAYLYDCGRLLKTVSRVS